MKNQSATATFLTGMSLVFYCRKYLSLPAHVAKYQILIGTSYGKDFSMIPYPSVMLQNVKLLYLQ